MCSIRDLHAYAPLIFEDLRVIKFTTETKSSEKTMPIETLKKLMDKIGSDDLIFDGFKVLCPFFRFAFRSLGSFNSLNFKIFQLIKILPLCLVLCYSFLIMVSVKVIHFCN